MERLQLLAERVVQRALELLRERRACGTHRGSSLEGGRLGVEALESAHDQRRALLAKVGKECGVTRLAQRTRRLLEVARGRFRELRALVRSVHLRRRRWHARRGSELGRAPEAREEGGGGRAGIREDVRGRGGIRQRTGEPREALLVALGRRARHEEATELQR